MIKTRRLTRLLVTGLCSFALLATALAAARAGSLEQTPMLTPPAQPAPLYAGALPDGQGPWVVRAFFTNRAMLDAMSAQIEPWEVHSDKGYLVVQVDRFQYEWLLSLGFRLEVDDALTAAANRPNTPLPGQINGIPGYPCYRTVEETYTTAQNLVAANPGLASWLDAGDSWEKITPGGAAGYNLRVLRLTNALTPGPKPKLFVMSSIHAREYTPAELNTRFAEYLLENYNLDADVTWLLDYHEVHLLLQSNPDGRKQAETGLSWRKNTDNNYCTNSNLRGADLNRNFAFQWGCCGGSSGSTCAEIYRGPSPASEPETQVVQNYVRSQFPDQREANLTAPAPANATGVFIDLHSYSQLVLWPWGFDNVVAPNGAALQTLGRKFANFNSYTPQQAYELYVTDGTTDDFAYGDLGLAAYTFELGSSFFQDCNTFENSILPDNLPALLYAARVARTPYLTPSGPDVLQALAQYPGTGSSILISASIDDTRFNNTRGTEPTQNITDAEYTIDVPPWITNTTPLAYPMSATDGLFNNKIEGVTASLDTTGLSQGRHTIFIRGRDANGNWGPVSAVFIFILDPAVSPHLEGYVRQAGSNLPLPALVSAAGYGGGTFQTNTNPATGYYSLMVISGTYNLSASALGHGPASVSGVVARDYQTIQQNLALTPICSIFSDDVEAGNPGWLASLPWAITSEASHSFSHSWTESPGGQYSNDRDIALLSPILNLTGYTNVSLDFWHTYSMEPGWDFGYVDYSTNGGTSWTTAETFTGFSSGWTQVAMPLAALNGQVNVRMRFRFTSDPAIVLDGWHIDDIALSGSSAGCPTAAAPLADFTSNSPQVDGQPVLFTNLSTGSEPLTFGWNFGDGSSVSSKVDPTHIYPTAGTYTATLTATNTLGASSASHPVVIQPCIPIDQIDLTQVTTGTLFRKTLVDFRLDSLPANASKPYSYTVDFDDGLAPLQAASSTATALFSHSFDLMGTYHVQAVVQNCPSVIPITATLPVSISPQHGITLTPALSDQTGFPGSLVTHTLHLANTGDTTDTITLTLGASSWPAVLNSPISPITLTAGGSHDVTVQLSIPVSAALGALTTTSLSAESSYASAGVVTSSLITRAGNPYNFLVTPTSAEKTGYPGQTITYTLTIENTGSLADTYQIDISRQTWQTTPLPDPVTIPPGMQAGVILSVNIPPNPAELSDNAVVTIQSEGDADHTIQAALTTRSRWRVLLPAIQR